MYVTPDQVATMNKAAFEAAIGIANSQLAAFERLSAINLNATRSAYESAMGHAKALLAAKDAQEFASLNTAAAQPTLETAIAYSRSVFEVATQTQGDLTKLIESQAAEFNRNLSGTLDKIAKNAPAGSDVAIAAVKSALAAANTAYDTMTKAARQASELAEANFTAATSVVKETKKKAA